MADNDTWHHDDDDERENVAEWYFYCTRQFMTILKRLWKIFNGIKNIFKGNF